MSGQANANPPMAENSLGKMRFYAKIGEGIATGTVFVYNGIYYEIIGGQSILHEQVTQEPELVTFVAVEVGRLLSMIAAM